MVKPLAVVQTVEDTPQHCLSWKHSKAAVLNSLGSLQSRRSYKHAIEEFIRWYCSEGLALNRAVVLRYRLHLERIPSRLRRSTFAWLPFAELLLR